MEDKIGKVVDDYLKSDDGIGESDVRAALLRFAEWLEDCGYFETGL